jgi:hypothetical protein
LRALLAAALLGACLVAPAGDVAARGSHPPRQIRHFFGGWTRTTWYVQCCITASGRRVFYGEVAAPDWVPLGATVVIPGLGRFLALDRGGAVWGNHLDVYLPWPGYHYVADYYTGVYWTD